METYRPAGDGGQDFWLERLPALIARVSELEEGETAVALGLGLGEGSGLVAGAGSE